MNDGRWMFFRVMNYILLGFYFFSFILHLSFFSQYSGWGIPFLYEMYMILPPLTGIVNCLFNRSVINKHYQPAIPMGAAKLNWQLAITLLHLIAYGLILLQLVQALSGVKESDMKNDKSFETFLQVLLLVYGIAGLYMTGFQLISVRKAGITPEESGTQDDDESDVDDESDDEVESINDDIDNEQR